MYVNDYFAIIIYSSKMQMEKLKEKVEVKESCESRNPNSKIRTILLYLLVIILLIGIIAATFVVASMY